MGKSSVWMIVCSYIRPSPPPLGYPASPEAKPARSAAQSARLQASGFRHGWMGLNTDRLGLRPGWIAQRDECTDNRTDRKYHLKIRIKQRKETADHSMAQGNLFSLLNSIDGFCDASSIRPQFDD